MNKITNRENIFNQTSPLKVKRNGFDLTHTTIRDWDMGKLYPISVHEVYPNDFEKTNVNFKMILETLQKPIYTNIKVKFKEFDVAYRNLWKHWRNYYTGGRKGDFVAQEPKVNLNCKSNVVGSLFDHLGFPLQSQLKGDVFVSAFPFIAYDFIYFWNFINPELQENIVYNIQDNLGLVSKNAGEYCYDELRKFVYYVSDFYMYNEDGIPLYCRMLNKVASASGLGVKVNTNYDINSRYYFDNTNNIPVGLVVDTASAGATAPAYKPLTDDGSNIGKITNAEYRNLVNIGFLYNVNWERDYYTSSHLSQQQGSPVGMPISVKLPEKTTEDEMFPFVNVSGVKNSNPSSYDYLNVNSGLIKDGVTGSTNFTNGYMIVNPYEFNSKNVSTSFSPNDFRLIWQVNMIKENILFNQKNFEYASYLQFFFGRSPNSRELQQPNYIGGISSNFYTSEVVQTSQTTDNSSLGEFGGKGQCVDSGKIDGYTFDEIGLSMMLMYIVPDLPFQSSQGVNRMWLRNDRFDYYNPLLANIGLQEVQNQEVYAQGNSDDKEVFGYTPAFNELRYIPDSVCGNMRDKLDFWHLARKYDKLPVLNSAYLQCNPSKRIFSVQQKDTPNITGIVNIVKLAYRDMPELAIPELLDHRY